MAAVVRATTAENVCARSKPWFGASTPYGPNLLEGAPHGDDGERCGGNGRLTLPEPERRPESQRDAQEAKRVVALADAAAVEHRSRDGNQRDVHDDRLSQLNAASAGDDRSRAVSTPAHRARRPTRPPSTR